MFVWIALVASALLAGLCFVGVLAVRRSAEPVAAILSITAFGVSTYSLVIILESYERVDVVFYGLALMTAGAAGGWALGSSLLERPAKASIASTPESPDTVSGKSIVVVCSCIEPAHYDPASTSGILQSLAHEELLEPSLGTLPFLYFAQKARYRAVGGTSPSLGQLRAVAERLDEALVGAGTSSTLAATCSGPDRLAAMVVRAVQAGCERVVVAPIAAAESLHLSQAKREVDAMRMGDSGCRVTYTDVLHGAERLVDLVTARVLATTATPETTGAVLVGHGQPESRAQRNPALDEQETAFLSRIRMRLVDAGLAESHVRIAWAEWKSPDVTAAVRHLAAMGCERVIVAPAVYPFDCVGTLLDLELAVRQARVEDDVSVVTLPAWKDDMLLVEELAERVRAALDAT